MTTRDMDPGVWSGYQGPSRPSHRRFLRNDIDVGDALNELKIAHDKRPFQSSLAAYIACGSPSDTVDG